MNLRLRDRLARFDSSEGAAAIDLRDAPDAPGVSAALEALDLDADDPLATLTERPPPLRRALAAAARERGRDHHADDERRRIAAALEGTLDAIEDAGEASDLLAAARRRAAEAGADVDRLRERTATLRGRLAEARERTNATEGDGAGEADAAVDAIRAEFAAATRDLTEAETERHAAEQALARAVEVARSARDDRERRLRLRDALANRRRAARRDLARGVYPVFAGVIEAFHSGANVDAARCGAAVAAVGDNPSEFEGDPVVAHAAAVRIAGRSDPVIVATDRFADPTEASAWLRAPVVRVVSE
ncbi:DUF7856 family protein [Halobaculum gomorrense]|uniref:Uncharacterized protein n=1 Tax=Halobaculum gomorrense TaxID=43928 RepID=A0A1M5QM27_9EURY|nr:hypothetical protein [Halobaculum gomorrense]SHH14770.1 hypothetical protein SAMN05443636_1953 [Halobaculum gomorrense]